MALEVAKRTLEFLRQHPEQKFKAREIAKWIFETYPDESRRKQKRSTVIDDGDDAALLQQITAEIGAYRLKLQRDNPELKTTEGRPRKYYFTELEDSTEIEHAESGEASPASKEKGSEEHELYPMLSRFLKSELGIQSKRINEKRSSNTRGAGGNRWLHPDLVGMEDLSDEWHPEIKKCVGQYADKRTKLWSFEVKNKINSSNVREAFFQAVSNSSWANFGYLVAKDIEGTLEELRMLASLHGIGFILLDIKEPAESQIMIPAKERNEIDWDSANRLAKNNKDFLEYIKSIRQFYQAEKISPSDWDTPVDEEA